MRLDYYFLNLNIKLNMKNTLLTQGNWNNFIISIDNKLLDNDLIEYNLKQFWNEVMNKLDESNYVFFMFKVKFGKANFKSLTKLQKINNKDFSSILILLIDSLSIRSEDYHSNVITSVVFTYQIIPQDKLNLVSNKSNIISTVNKVDNSFRFGGYKLPSTMDYLTWGNLISKESHLVVIQKYNSDLIYRIKLFDGYNEVSLMNNKIVIVSFKDVINDPNNLNTFTRYLEHQEYIFINGNLIVKKLVRKTSFLKTIKAHNKINNKFLTLDIETRTLDNIITPYCISIYDGTKATSFYLSEYNSPEEMIKVAITSILIRKYNNHKVYVHNLSHFDGIFLIKIFSSLDNVNVSPIMNDGKIFDIQLNFNKYHINLRDSLLLLPDSLKKLAKAFNVEAKGIFPYTFADEVNLNYNGDVPAFRFFDNITQEEYNSYKSNFVSNNWNLKQETIKYCELDCISLYQVLVKFNELIFNKYQLNIHKFPTLPSLAFAIYRCKYLVNSKIPLISGEIFNNLRKSYTGGHTDVYIPYGENVGCYDVNSLYPSSMKTYPMPIGNVTYFEGDITKTLTDAFGFFEVEVTSPEVMDRPLLQTKIEINNGFRTIAPLGNWTDMIFSEEMNEYQKYGYSFKVLRGYLFDKGFIFEDYVQDLYNIKENEPKNSPMYLISKLLMNSLYGRFGMDYNTLISKHTIVYNELSYQILDKNIITDIINLDDDQILISYYPKDIDEILNLEYFDNQKFKISISIASAVTAYARIHMSSILADPSIRILYTDTDSFFIEGELDPNLIGTGLGKFKLEYRFKECVFLAPKVYGGILNDGSELTKVKGFKDEVKYSDLKSLLVKDSSLELNQDKWFRSIEEGSITIKNQLYKLVPTENKRELIYSNNKFVNTKPFVIK